MGGGCFPWRRLGGLTFRSSSPWPPPPRSCSPPGSARRSSTTYALTGVLVGVGAASTMVFGGIVGARRVARTLSEKITPMDPLQGFAANLITSILVSGASQFALPVSTIHVACGSLFGISLLRGGESNRRQILQILFAWGVTLPLAAFLAISFYLIRIWL